MRFLGAGIVLHGVTNILVKENVVFDAVGHCYYLEDGTEERNRFISNLAAFIHVIGRPAAGALQEGETFFQVSLNS